MSLLRSSSAVARPTLLLPLSLRLPARSFSQTSAVKGGGVQYDPPTGWLFGRKPGEKRVKEGWENVWYYGYCGGFVVAAIAYAFKPDTRFVLSLFFLVEGLGSWEWCGDRMETGKIVEIGLWLTRVIAFKLGPLKRHADGWKRRAFCPTRMMRRNRSESTRTNVRIPIYTEGAREEKLCPLCAWDCNGRCMGCIYIWRRTALPLCFVWWLP
jgi:hypothetical protein